MTIKVKSALMRAIHAFWETLAATSPVGLVITVPMIREADWRTIGLSVLAWLGTAVLSAILSFVKSMAVGMPEATPADVSLTWEQFKADQGTVTVISDEHQEAVDSQEGIE